MSDLFLCTKSQLKQRLEVVFDVIEKDVEGGRGARRREALIVCWAA
jgi:hypothetical protein